MAGCFCFANPSGFLFGLSQKGTICSNVCAGPPCMGTMVAWVAYSKWPPQIILWNAIQVLWDLDAKQVSLFQARIDLSWFETILGYPRATQGVLSLNPFWDD